MPRPRKRDEAEQQVLNLLAANPQGISSPRLRAQLKPRLSQPTVARLLMALRARGKVLKTGNARGTRYHLAEGRVAAAELRSRLLHERVAEELVRHPELKQQAIRRLKLLRKVNPHGRRYHERWEELLQSDMPRLLRAMTEDSEQAAVLRRESPFTTLFDPKLRHMLFHTARLKGDLR